MSAPDTISAPSSVDDEVLIERSTDLAYDLLRRSQADETARERRRRDRLGRLLADPDGRDLLFAMTDQVLRIDDPALAARRFADVVHRHRTTAMGPVDTALLRLGAIVAPRTPKLVMPLVVRRIRAETRGVVIPADDPAFARHVERRSGEGVRINVNPLGEAILSDTEAEERMATVIARIERGDVDHVSVKVSAIVANLDVLAFDDSVERICERLRTLYRTAESTHRRTFVNLDMEEYRDLELTLTSFMSVLGDDEFASIDAGIVLQAYLPDSHDALERLGAWATDRHTRAGGTVKVRLVKGANLAMEHVEAELHGWTAAPYPTKADVDASYKAILDSALRPDWAGALRVGLASHNLFDVAWAITLADAHDLRDRIEFEMLEGMAPAQARATFASTDQLVMYAPVVADDDVDASIAYLSRRLDENTQPDNFLRALFTLTPGSEEFERESERFRTAVLDRHAVSRARRRAPSIVPPPSELEGFVAEPDSDLTDAATRAAFASALVDPPQLDVVVVDSETAIDDVIATATSSFSRGAHDPSQRRRWLLDAAALMSSERAATAGLLATTAAKTVHEADPEISEAIDFCRYYPTEGREFLVDAERSGCSVRGRGVVVVVGPWNFPYAIPTGGVAGAIAAGNSVVLKPAPEVAEIGAWIADQFWRAGVPRDVLQLVVCEDGPVGKRLVTHPGIDTVVLTGAYETASMFLDWRPDLRVLAETSGKDALVITPSADLDLAISDLVRSAFAHAGQKCSAASLGIVVAEVYDDPSFHRRLRDAVTSLRIGAAADPSTMVGPLIAPPTGKLDRALTTLEPGESWLVEPRLLDTPGTPAGTSWSPGVRAGVRPGSWFHQNECFGPVLGLVRADDLDHAIDIQNDSDYGLTGGIHSLDEAEVAHWLERVEIGNAYVNRHITGAIVRRQPFGGWKRSAVGGGAKAGGPGYVSQLSSVTDAGPAPETSAAFTRAWRDFFTVDHDPTGLDAEANVLRHRPLGGVVARVDDPDDDRLEVLQAASSATGTHFEMSATRDESDDDFVERMVRQRPDRVRLLTAMDTDARRVLHAAGVVVTTDAPVSAPFVELSRWVLEQSVSRTLHRHGRRL
ncbi:MAG: proline dehydrogenase family protein, partial [Ilumatobacter sp.]